VIVVGLIDELLGLFQSLLSNFITITTPSVTFDASRDGQIVLLSAAPGVVTAKGNALTGALADVITSGAQLLDLLMQTLVGFSPEAPVLAAGSGA
jgi:hypothetical protein